MAEIPKFAEFKMPEIDVTGMIEAMAEAVRPIKLSSIALEAIDEVSKARAKHGSNADLAYGVGPEASILGEANLAGSTNHGAEVALQALNDSGCANGRSHTRLGILLEEAFEAASAENPAELRKELIQVAAMALDWIVDLDDRAADDDIDQED